MRRSSAVKLTLLPMLASAAVAAQPAPGPEPGEEGAMGPPGAGELLLAPPGMTPTIEECQQDPDNERCPQIEVEEDEIVVSGYRSYIYGYGGYGHGGHRWLHHRVHCVHRGGFGQYFSALTGSAGAIGHGG